MLNAGAHALRTPAHCASLSVVKNEWRPRWLVAWRLGWLGGGWESVEWRLRGGWGGWGPRRGGEAGHVLYASLLLQEWVCVGEGAVVPYRVDLLGRGGGALTFCQPICTRAVSGATGSCLRIPWLTTWVHGGSKKERNYAH